jgi:SAM-dependent methyltransferase
MTPNTYSSTWFQLFMPRQTEEQTRNEIAFLTRQLPLPRYRRVLDLCCGYGRHAIGLAAQGYEVTGLDRDEEAIAEARRRTQAAGVSVTYLTGDMRELSAAPGTFDAVINMWQSLNFFDEETNAQVMRAIHSKLTPGGRFIVDSFNREYFERNQGESSQEIDGVTVETHAYMQGGRWHSALTYRDAQGAIIGGDHMEWQAFSPDELIALAATCGFTTRLACAWAKEDLAPSPEFARMQLVLERE